MLFMLIGFVNFFAAPTVQLLFSSHITKSKVEKFRGHILQAFESVLGSPVTIEIRCESGKDGRAGPIVLSAPHGVSHIGTNPGIHGNGVRMAGPDEISRAQVNDSEGLAFRKLDSRGIGGSEIVEEEASPRESKHNDQIDNNTQFDRRNLERDFPGGIMSIAKNSSTSIPERRNLGDRSQSLSLVKSKVSLAHVIQQAEGCTRQSSWSKRKAVSIADKLEQENLYVPLYPSFLYYHIIYQIVYVSQMCNHLLEETNNIPSKRMSLSYVLI